MRLDLPALPAFDPTLALALAAAAALAVLAVLAIVVRRRLVRRPRPAPPTSRPSARDLLRRFDALARAAAERTRRGERPLRPWWLVIGPAGHGKSSLLAAAPRCVEIAPGPPGEPRFFLAPYGVFLELPEGAPPAALLRALRRQDPPAAGVLVVLRADALADDAALALVRTQLDHLAAALALQVPVVLTVAQLDRLSGFAELTADLSSRTSVLGATLPPRSGPDSLQVAARERLTGEGGPLAWVRQRCHALVARARTDDERTARLHGFWQLFERLLAQAAAAAARLAAGPDDPARVRAIYFTSASPGGPPPADTWLAGLADRIGSPTTRTAPVDLDEHAPPPIGPSFVADLFAVELPRDSRYATRPRAFFRRRAALAALAATAAVLTTAALTCSATATAQADRALLRATWTGARGVGLPSSNLLPPLADLATLADAIAGWRTDRGWRFTPDRDIAPRAADVLRRAVCRGVLRHVAGRSERALRDFAGRHVGGGVPTELEWTRAHDRLRLYLLLSTPAAGDPDPWDEPESTWLIEHVSQAWSATEGDAGDPRRAAVLRRHAELTLAARADAPPDPPSAPDSDDPCARTDHARAVARDPALVADVREVLHRRPAERVALARMLEQIDRRTDASPVSRTALTTAGALVGDATIRPAFTRPGWEAFREALRAELRARSDHGWVLGPGPSHVPPSHRCERLRALYVARYEQAWRDFLAALRLRAPSSLPEAASLLQEIAEQAPLAAIVRAVDEHTQHLTPLGCPGDDRLADLLTRTLTPAPAAAPAPDAPELAAAFTRFVTFAIPPRAHKSPPPLASYHERLAEVRGAVQAAIDNNAELPALQSTLTHARRSVDDLIRRGALGPWADPLDRLLAPPLAGLELLVDNAAGRALGEEWCAAIVRPIEQTIAAHYPFDPDARSDARLDDLTRLFHPTTGELARFRDARLGGFIAVSGNSVRPRELGVAASLHLSPRVVDLLDAAHKLGVLLYPDDAPSLAAELTLACDPSVHKVILLVDGAEHTYLCSIDHSKQIVWPGEREPRGAALLAHGPAGRRGELPAAGDFGLLRLFERGRPEGRVGAFHLAFDLARHGLGTLRLAVRPRPVRGGDPFFGFDDGPFLAPFRAPALVRPPHALFAELGSTCAP